MTLITLREIGINKCDHHQTVVSSNMVGIGDVSRGSSQPSRVRYNDKGKNCILCQASILFGEWVGGSVDIVIDTDKINLELLAIRFPSSLVYLKE